MYRGMLIALITGWMLAPTDVSAQMICGERDAVFKNLYKNYGETSTGRGIASDNDVIELLVSTQGTFTIVMNRADGTSCLLISGKNWENTEGWPFPYLPMNGREARRF